MMTMIMMEMTETCLLNAVALMTVQVPETCACVPMYNAVQGHKYLWSGKRERGRERVKV